MSKDLSNPSIVRARADATTLIQSALGTALEWEEAKQHADHVREWGIKVNWEILSLDDGLIYVPQLTMP